MRSMKESREDYLEAILILNRKRPEDVRPVDVANYLELTKPSVTRAMGELEKEGHVVRNAKGRILLTESGKRIRKLCYNSFDDLPLYAVIPVYIVLTTLLYR